MSASGKSCNQCGCQFVGRNVCRATGEPDEFLHELAVLRAYHEKHRAIHAGAGNQSWTVIHTAALKAIDYCAELHRRNVETAAMSGPGWMGH